MTGRGLLDGDNIIYYYFRDELIRGDTEESRHLIRRMIHDLSIWLPPKLYVNIPVLLPFVVRDPTCRKSVNKKREEWGSCDSKGYFRDDNTLVKGIPRRFGIASDNRTYSGRKMGKGFVASHMWSKLSGGSGLATGNPMTNSFVPNLVWLPRQLSKLTDREGLFVQKYLQKLSVSIFKNIRLSNKKSQFVDRVWKLLEDPNDIPLNENELQGLNFFVISDIDIKNMLRDLLDKIDMIQKLEGGKVYCSRYLKTYSSLSMKTRASLASRLLEYARIVT